MANMDLSHFESLDFCWSIDQPDLELSDDNPFLQSSHSPVTKRDREDDLHVLDLLAETKTTLTCDSIPQEFDDVLDLIVVLGNEESGFEDRTISFEIKTRRGRTVPFLGILFRPDEKTCSGLATLKLSDLASSPEDIPWDRIELDRNVRSITRKKHRIGT
jgi:hypothetical protein